MKHVLILCTGGTIASREGEDGLEPAIDGVELVGALGNLSDRYAIDTRQILSLDSSNIQAEEWQLIARTVYENLGRYDGIIITHGTDTMAYTASALSYMLENLDKPVVLTGAQLPVDNLLTDARNNLFCALAAIDAGICGVSIAFNHRIIRGCRAVKVRTMAFGAFESVNARYLGEVFASGLHCYEPSRRPAGPCVLRDQIHTNVFLLKLIPNTKPELFDQLAALGYRGVVLETFGAGGLHFRHRDLLEKLRRLRDLGIAVVACSQCLYETSDFTIYEVGRKLLEAGVIPGRDMTSEAAVTKLMWGLGQGLDAEGLRRLFETDLAGEVTLET